MQKNNINLVTSEENTLNIRQEIEKYLNYWPWFVLGVLLMIGVTFVYLRYTSPKFIATASILIKDNQKSGISDELRAIADLGIVGTGSINNTDNEIEILKSRKIIGAVVDSLHLQEGYFTLGKVKSSEKYKNAPFKVVLNDSVFNSIKRDTIIYFSFLGNEDFLMSDKEEENQRRVKFNQEIFNSNLGSFYIKNEIPINDVKGDFIFKISIRDKVIDHLLKMITVSPVDKNSSVLRLSLVDGVKEKAESILDELVKQYNLDAIKDKNLVSEKTKLFIDERLQTVGVQLADIQDEVKNYKDRLGITGLSTEAELVLGQLVTNNNELVKLKTQQTLAEWIQDQLRKSDKSEVIPTNIGIVDVGIVASINQYNELILIRDKLSRTAGNQNPQLLEIKRQLRSLRKNLLQSLLNLNKSLEIQFKELEAQAKKVASEASRIPLIERGMIDIERQKLIYSELYSYLLKKKEETAISLAISVPNAKIIDYAYSNGIPVSPKKTISYLIAFLIGLFIPFVVIYFKELIDTKVHYRGDIENSISVPFVGDIPHAEEDYKIVVKENARSSSAEAFRLLRTNLNFLLPLGIQGLGKIIFTTSTTSGEGKSLVSMNLAATLSLANSKVLLLGMDLRAPKITEYLEITDRAGITNYITRDDVPLESLKFQVADVKNLDIIASGVIPPNPAELLLHPKVDQLFEKVKKEYDYIVVDTAPVNLVTDTLLISKYADVTLYIVRANYLDKRMLVVPETLYNEKKLNNMAIVLNDTDVTKSYGYGYGYGYGYVDSVKKPWYKRIF